jgi:hypothetical protein
MGWSRDSCYQTYWNRSARHGEIASLDADCIYGIRRECKVSLTRVNPSREDLVSGRARRDFPTGVVFVYLTENIEDALNVVRAYQSN